jgi:chromosome segregation ATPase
MNIKRSLLVATAASAIGTASIVGLASAADGASTNGTTLVDRVAQHFNLSKDEVQKVFNEDHSARQAERETQYEARLTQAVKDGKLTEDQKTKILTKHKELVQQMESKRSQMEADRQAMAGKTEAERQALRQQHKTEMDTRRQAISDWEKANNIPSGYLFGGPGGHGGMMGGHGHGGPGGPGEAF